jgi:hypothetical protein
MRFYSYLILGFMAISLSVKCCAGWEAGRDWKVASDYTLSVSSTGEVFAWNTGTKPDTTWSFTGHMKILGSHQNNACARLALGTLKHDAIITVNIEHLVKQGLSLVSVDAPGGLRARMLTSGWMPGGDNSYDVSIFRTGNSMTISVIGNKGFRYLQETMPVTSRAWKSAAMFGLGTYASDVEFSDIKFSTPYSPPGHYTAQAKGVVDDLVKNFWIGGPDEGCIVPTYSGYPGTIAILPNGGMWERGMMVFALDAYFQATGDPLTKHRIASEWARMKRVYTMKELVEAGGNIHPAADDCGWDAALYWVFYRDLGDPYALEMAKGLVDNAYNRWHDDKLGGGMWYDNSRTIKSLYCIQIPITAWHIWEATGDISYREKAMNCYDWTESHLARPDGLYFMDFNADGPVGKERPNDIHEAGSVSSFAGSMAMAVFHARLYRETGDKKYLDRAIRTAEGISRVLVKNGAYYSDRDAWTSGTFAPDWVQEVLTLPGIHPKHKQLLLNTADSICKNDRTEDGYYGGCWGGPADGPGSPWSMIGSRPQQIMTSATTGLMVISAALTENDVKMNTIKEHKER